MTLLVVSDAIVTGKVRAVRLETAAGPISLGLHENRKKVPHPGLQHVIDTATGASHVTRPSIDHDSCARCR